MSFRFESAFRVGLLVFVGLIIFLGSAFWLRSFIKRKGPWFVAEFHRAMGLEVGSEVFVQGIRVGTVDKVDLYPPSKVKVVVKLEKPVPVYHNSHITIRMGTLIGQPYVDIINPSKAGRIVQNGETVVGIDPVSWEEIVPQASEVVEGLRSILGDQRLQKNLRTAISDLAISARAMKVLLKSIPSEDVKTTASNFKDLSGKLASLIADKRLDFSLSYVEKATSQMAKLLSDPNLMEGLPKAVRETEQTMATLRKILADQEIQKNLKSLLDNLREASKSLQQFLSEEGAAGELHRLLEEVKLTVANIREVTADPEVQQSVKTTSKNLADLTEQAKSTLNEVELTLQQIREVIQDTKDNLKAVAEHLEGITADLDETTEAFKWLMTEGGMKENLRQVGENLKATTENLKVITEEARQLLTGEKTKQSLHQGLYEVGPTIYTVKQTAEKGQRLLKAITDWRVQPEVRVWFLPESDETRSETILKLFPHISPVELLTGMYTDRKGSLINLQIQGKINESVMWRFGTMRSKLGVGLGWGIQRLTLDVDAFDPDRWQVNAWLNWKLSPSLHLRLGMEDIGRSRNFGIGAEIGRR